MVNQMPQYARREAKVADPSQQIQNNTAAARPRATLESEARQVAQYAFRAAPQVPFPAAHHVAELGPVAGGERLPDNLRRRFEPVFGHDFGKVRVHADQHAADAADALGASAFTVGSHVLFGAGCFAPETPSGQRLVAHELTHVVQQQGGPAILQRDPDPAKPQPKEDPADKEIAAHEASLKARKGLKASERVNDKTTADTVEDLIEASVLLRPYIRDKVVSTSVGKNFTIYDSAAEFEYKQTKLDKTVSPNTGGHSANVVYGFYHRKSDSIHLRPDASVGHALHEGIHKYSSVLLQVILGIFVNEGITQKYTDQVLAEHGVPGKVNHAYGPQLEAAEVLAGWFTADDFAKAYFQGQGVSKIRDRVVAELAVTTQELPALASGNEGQDLADKIVDRKGKKSRVTPPAVKSAPPHTP